MVVVVPGWAEGSVAVVPDRAEGSAVRLEARLPGSVVQFRRAAGLVWVPLRHRTHLAGRARLDSVQVPGGLVRGHSHSQVSACPAVALSRVLRTRVAVLAVVLVAPVVDRVAAVAEARHRAPAVAREARLRVAAEVQVARPPVAEVHKTRVEIHRGSAREAWSEWHQRTMPPR